jgi:cytochrome c oxidase assembly protein subunit 11
MLQESTKRRKRHILIMAFIAIAMFGFGYALVPLYNVLCKQLGINGKISGQAQYDPSKTLIDKNRSLLVEFLTTDQANLHGKFFALKGKVRVHPGEQERVAFYVENPSNHPIVLQAIPSVSPGIAARYLKKTECFCFVRQTLAAKEGRDMPVVFHFDPELPKEIKVVTVSYTIYDVTART